MRFFISGWVIALGVATAAPPAQADCAVIDQIDHIYAIQRRLLRDPDTVLFTTDIRQLRHISRLLSDDAALAAVDGNAFTGKGGQVMRLLANTRDLLEMASLDDPYSVRRHFDGAAIRNLDAMGAYLLDLRCTQEQIAIAQVQAAASAAQRGQASTDAEDLANVRNSLAQMVEQVLQPRRMLILLLTVTAGVLLWPFVQRWLILRRRRARRFNTHYQTYYHLHQIAHEGTLLDLNCHGAKLEHDSAQPPGHGDLIAVTILQEDIPGTVVWSNAHYSGIQFRKTLEPDTVRQVVKTGREQKKRRRKKKNGAPQDAAFFGN